MAAAPQRKDIEIPVPAGSDGFTSLSWAPSTNFLAASSWDNKVRYVLCNQPVPKIQAHILHAFTSLESGTYSVDLAMHPLEALVGLSSMQELRY
jgi:hypothetical protein